MAEFAPSTCKEDRRSVAGTGSVAGDVSPFRKIAAIPFALVIGTGGMMTADYFSHRNEMGYRFVQVENCPSPRSAPRLTPSEYVAIIRDTLKPTVSEFASWLQVSRQTVYHWQNGTQPTAEYAKKLEDLSKAAYVFRAEGIPVNSSLLKRRITSGKSLIDVFIEGGSAEEAARQLTNIVLIEYRQQKALDARLSKRKLPALAYSDAGIPAFDEKSS